MGASRHAVAGGGVKQLLPAYGIKEVQVVKKDGNGTVYIDTSPRETPSQHTGIALYIVQNLKDDAAKLASPTPKRLDERAIAPF